MTRFVARMSGTEGPPPQTAFCDAWLADGQRFGDEFAGIDSDAVLGRWPGALETDVIVGLAETVGENPTWDAYANSPAVAQKLAEKAQVQPLDLEISRHLQHLQHVCHQPRLHLRMEEERLPVYRARRTPVRAVAELVSHPGDWEHRTLRSIQPSRVLARQTEDEWNLYENRVAVRLVDRLCVYLRDRLKVLREIRKIVEELEASRDYGDETRGTSFWRAHRISELWSTTLEAKTGEELGRTTRRVERMQRAIQALLDAPLYSHVPRRETVAPALKPTNILVNDPHYRKVAALWRATEKLAHKHQETIRQRRQREAAAWDRFVLHLVVRGFSALGWTADAQGSGWILKKLGWLPVRVEVDAHRLVRVSSQGVLCLVPLCADLSAADGAATLAQVEALDGEHDEVVVVHVGHPAALADADRASGWSIGRRAVLLACSPWGIDSEERMARLLHGWLSRAAVPAYPPAAITIRALPEWSGRRDWIRYEGDRLVVFRAPTDDELKDARAWSKKKAKELDADGQQAKKAKRASAVAPRNAIKAFDSFIEDARSLVDGLDACPVCGDQGSVEARPGSRVDGADATWWAKCPGCESEWGTRRCVACGLRYRALTVGDTGLDLEAAAPTTAAPDWPDRVLGRDVWAQPCAERPLEHFRCPGCGRCPSASCVRCSSSVFASTACGA